MASSPSAGGRSRPGLPMICIAICLAVPLNVGSQPGDPEWTPPRTPWGDPDLTGTWPIDHLNGTPLQRPAEFGERRYLTDEEFAEREQQLALLNARYDNEIEGSRMGIGHWAELGEPNRLTSLVMDPANGRLPPMTAEGERMAAQMSSTWDDRHFDGIDDFNALERCITRGMPASMFPFMYNSGMQILQAPGYVVLRLELIHETRIIPVDGRPPLPDEMRHWLGESRGHWDGDTLVVETTNFNGRTPMTIVGPSGNRYPTSESLRIVERMTRVADNTIHYEVTVEDPVVLTAPWTAAFPWQNNPDYYLFEYACHEGNEAIRLVIGGSRAERAGATP